MHTNPAFRSTPDAVSLDFLRRRGFGTLTLNGPRVPLVSHVPFLLSDDGASAEIHLTRSNPICRAARGGAPALLAVTGPDAYVSPDWYGLPDQVPTWNYVAVHLEGRLEPLPETETRGLVDRLSAAFEARLAPKPAWTSDKMPDEAMARLLRMILPFRFHVGEMRSTWKLGQNKPEAARQAAGRGVAAGSPGQEAAALGALMQAPPAAQP
jgi:transcriptional regulator